MPAGSLRRLLRLPLLGTLVAAAGAAAALPAAPASAAFPGGNGQIVFEGAGGAIQKIDPAGSNLAAIPNTSGAGSPAASPSGTRIAFQQGGNIVTSDLEGGDRKTLSAGSGPAWSPDGLRIAYARFGDLFVMNADGTGSPQQITSGPASDNAPAWAPSGDRVAFVSDRSGDDQVWVVRAGAAPPVPPWQVTAVGDVDSHRPSWSPNGTRLTYAIDDGRIVDVYVTADPGPPDPHDPKPLDPADDHRITVNGSSAIFNEAPAWSPDGTKIVFSSNRTGAHELWRTPAPGGGSDVQITTTGGRSPDWLPLADADGDALLDTWETNGIDTDSNGTIDLDLPGMGARVDHKDIFVEMDCMPPHCYDDSTIERVVDAFGVAPVPNPDGHNGITLHVDNGADSVMDPATDASWGGRSEAEGITHQDALGTTTNGVYDWSEFDTLKQLHFKPEREQAFHYVISGHESAPSAAGISRGVVGGASDLIISQGRTVGGTDTTIGDDDFRANTFMHELGHNLGLHHGGSDDVNYKPNYLSVMNYVFAGTLPRFNGPNVLDYSRFVIPLDENSLDEDRGLSQVDDATGSLTITTCPGGQKKRTIAIEAQPVDWDCSGLASGSVFADTNNDGALTVLTSQTDWDKLVYDGGLVGAKVETPPATTVADEPTVEERLANQAQLRAGVSPVTTPPPSGAGPAGDPPPGSPALPDVTAPAFLGAVSVKPGRFAVPKGTTFRYRLSEDARVTFTIERRSSGRKVGGRCVRPTRSNRKRRSCTRFVRAATFAQAGKLGANAREFSGRVGKRKLTPGRYRATLRATDAAGNRSGVRRVSFRVVRRR